MENAESEAVSLLRELAVSKALLLSIFSGAIAIGPKRLVIV